MAARGVSGARAYGDVSESKGGGTSRRGLLFPGAMVMYLLVGDLRASSWWVTFARQAGWRYTSNAVKKCFILPGNLNCKK